MTEPFPGPKKSVQHVDNQSELAFFAHELNQPLTAILGNAQAARRFMIGSEISRDELLAILDDIIQDTKRAGTLIRDFQKQHSAQH